MKLDAGITEYVSRKRSLGQSFRKGELCLQVFSKKNPDIDLRQLTVQHILDYLDSSKIEIVTWRQRYYLLLRFFEFWFSRGEIPEFQLPPPKAAVRQTFVPYIFSQAEIRVLLRSTEQVRNPRSRIDSFTLRTIVLFLYATGALVGETLALLHRDLDLKESTITIRRKHSNKCRQIPIGSDLRNALQQYVQWRSKKSFENPHLFVAKDDTPLTLDRLKNDFKWLRQAAGITRRDSSISQTRLYDLKFTFAVHRITSWIDSGTDLNLVLPALAAYMGQVGLGATERYLALAPERFRPQLNKLSPAYAQRHWRDDKNLMEFLSGLE